MSAKDLPDKDLVREMVRRGLSVPAVETVWWCHDCGAVASFVCGAEWHNQEKVPKSRVVPATKARLI